MGNQKLKKKFTKMIAKVIFVTLLLNVALTSAKLNRMSYYRQLTRLLDDTEDRKYAERVINGCEEFFMSKGSDDQVSKVRKEFMTKCFQGGNQFNYQNADATMEKAKQLEERVRKHLSGADKTNFENRMKAELSGTNGWNNLNSKLGKCAMDLDELGMD